MHLPFIYAALLVAGAALVAPAAQAQAMQEWSAIEVTPTTARKTPPAAAPTVPVSGPAAGLLPNAARPAASARLKTDAAPLEGVLPTLTQLRPVRFKFLPGQGEEGNQYGFLPGDLARVYPELVKTNLMNGQQTITTAQLTPLLVEAIKELNGQIQVLQSQQLQLAEAYARLQQLSAASASSPAMPALLRRGRPGKKVAAGQAPAELPAEALSTAPEPNLD